MMFSRGGGGVKGPWLDFEAHRVTLTQTTTGTKLFLLNCKGMLLK